MRKFLVYIITMAMTTSAMACTSCSKGPEENNDQPASTQGTASTSADRSRTFTIGGATFKMLFVEHGTFTMGSDDTSVQFSESPAHRVTLTKDFLMGETEVTETLWRAVMANGGGSNTLPKTSVTWSDAHRFISKLNEMAHAQKLIADDENFRLPTEAQWEFAAKGGNRSKGYKYSGSNNINDVAVTRENSGSDSPINVKTKQPNELGLYDMSGNAYEWVDDRGGNYPSAAQTDPQNTTGSNYVKRGGSNYHSFSSEPYLFTTTGRYFYGSTDWTIGFRIALELPSATTGIGSAKVAKQQSADTAYTIDGRRVSADAKGLIIKDGKKSFSR